MQDEFDGASFGLQKCRHSFMSCFLSAIENMKQYVANHLENWFTGAFSQVASNNCRSHQTFTQKQGQAILSSDKKLSQHSGELRASNQSKPTWYCRGKGRKPRALKACRQSRRHFFQMCCSFSRMTFVSDFLCTTGFVANSNQGHIETNIGYCLGLLVTSLNDSPIILPVPN